MCTYRARCCRRGHRISSWKSTSHQTMHSAGRIGIFAWGGKKFSHTELSTDDISGAIEQQLKTSCAAVADVSAFMLSGETGTESSYLFQHLCAQFATSEVCESFDMHQDLDTSLIASTRLTFESERQFALLVDVSGSVVQVMLVGRGAAVRVDLSACSPVLAHGPPATAFATCHAKLIRAGQTAHLDVSLESMSAILIQHDSAEELQQITASLCQEDGHIKTDPSSLFRTSASNTASSKELGLPFLQKPLLALAHVIAEQGEGLAGQSALLGTVSSAGIATLLRLSFHVDNSRDGRGSLSQLQTSLRSFLASLTETFEENVGLSLDTADSDRTSRVIRSETKVWASGKPNVRVVITGVSAALPGREGEVFTPGVDNIQRILNGENFISAVPNSVKDAMLEKNVVTQRRGKDGTVQSVPVAAHKDTINVCASLGRINLGVYGISESIVSTMDRAVQVAVAAGLEALQDAGLVEGIRGTGPAAWELPEHMRDSTGVVYATSFPALDTAVAEVARFFESRTVASAQASVLVSELRRRLQDRSGELSAESEEALQHLERALSGTLEGGVPGSEPYAFDRKFLFRVLVLGNAQLAQIIKARGPNMQTNAACAGATQAIALGYDLIQVGRAERVVVIAGDNASSDNLMPWLGNGFRILGAATLCAAVSDAARPFHPQRSGMILGSGGIGMVLESEEGARRRHRIAQTRPTAAALAEGLTTAFADSTRTSPQPVPRAAFKCRLLGTLLSNSAYHGAAMDREHIAQEMERFIAGVEAEHGVTRGEIARHGVYFSHETGTHASPSSACAANEIYGLRKVFQADLQHLLILNTKGFTGHPMGVSFEDVVAVEALRTGRVPPIANFTEVDANLGAGLKMSRGGEYPCKYAIRFAAGFGSQIALALYGL